ncbi:MAG: hypothetical protein ACT4QB_14260 [Gammaproteobacteria bacterium]
MEEARESISQTVEDIKDTVEDQYESVKETVSGVLEYRDQFHKDPIVWSVGALSAGFALGYTLGYAQKNMKPAGRKRSEVAAFADALVDELSTVGNSLVMPSLNAKIKQLFGFDFSDMLDEIGGAKRTSGRKQSSRRGGARKGSETKRTARKGPAKKV